MISNHTKNQKLCAFLVEFLGAYLCQILEIDWISLVTFVFLVDVLLFSAEKKPRGYYLEL